MVQDQFTQQAESHELTRSPPLHTSEQRRGDPEMSTTPPDVPTEPGDNGPRVTRDEVRDLARIRRSRSDRKVAGVAGGLARHLDIDPLLLRVAFVILTFFGGGGLILYGVAWLVVPEEDTGRAVIRLDDGVRAVALIIAGVIAAAAILGDTFGGQGFPWPVFVIGGVLVAVFVAKDAVKPGGPTHPWLGGPPHPAGTAAAPPAGPYPGYQPGPPPPAPYTRLKRGPLLFPFTLALAALGVGVVATLHLAGLDVPPSAYPATVMAVVGLMLVVGAFYGRGGGLILVGLVAAAATAIVTATSGLDVGEITRNPDQASELAPAYEIGAGEIRINLTGIEDPENLAGRSLDLEAGFGRIEVIVPDDGLNVEVDATVEAGESRLFGDKSSGGSASGSFGEASDPTLTIDAEVVFGEIVVHAEGADR
jgi:phage shock protein PspC (stress-responsive transcriptional regulator)